MIKNKHEFASFITELFSRDDFKKQIANYASTTLYPYRYIGLILGDILTFYSATRSKNTSPKLLNDLIHNNVFFFNSYENLSKLIYNEMLEQNKTATPNQIINKIANNYITNGFYMHAFTSANLQGVLEKGLNPRHRLLEEERKIINRVAGYEFESCSNKLFVTGNYHILYSYGSLSPEWVYYCFKDSKVMYDKDYKKAYAMFIDKARKNLYCVKQLKAASDAAKKVFGHYLRNDLNVEIAVLDKFAKDENNEIIFKQNFKDNDEINPDEFLSLLNIKQYNPQNQQDEILSDVFKIVMYFSPYEECALAQFKKEDFGLIELPSYQEFTKLMSHHHEIEP